ncbi:MAG TPA: MFS transporter [Povalibacter sp.]|uniref:spinster family MFS transporter n=1 Tax=Povalibacter sp. TaxID=1962978 RepID=UPI002D1B5D0F|nr:MFS transporter [Povalibacter sp.]HMN44385.1 MFS transporter [Povalibacter sp.]
MNEPHGTTTPSGSTQPYPTPRQAWYMVFVLMIFYVFSFIDRQIISLLVEPIKRDMQITDTQIGLLQGFSFALFYCFLGVPIGWLADRKNRKKIIAVGVVVWSLMSTLCGFAKNFGQLFLARVGVGVGEAALSPAAYSMVTDAFPKERLGRAFSIYNLGIPIGSGIALLVGGLVVGAVVQEGKTFVLPLLGEVRAWQFVFIVTGAPGLLLPLLLLSVREPARRGLIKTATNETAAVPLSEVFKFMWKNGHFYSLHFVALALFAMLGYAVGAWLPTVISRTYAVPAADVGKVLGISVLSVNVLGILFFGRICDRLTARGITDAPIVVCILVGILIAITSTIPAFMPNVTLAYVAMCIAGFPFHGYVAMGPMAVNQVTPNQMRAQVSSVYLFVNALLGMGVGPALVPLISDYILKDPMQIRWALSIVVFCAGTLAAFLLWLERKPFRERVSASAQWH